MGLRSACLFITVHTYNKRNQSLQPDFWWCNFLHTRCNGDIMTKSLCLKCRNIIWCLKMNSSVNDYSKDIHSATRTGWFSMTCPFKSVWDRWKQHNMNRMIQQEMDKLTLPCPFTSVWEIPVVTEQLHMLLIVLLINSMQGTNSKTPRWVFTCEIE